jgi:hypothetical protein
LAFDKVAVELAAGGIERALVVFRTGMDEWATIVVNHLSEKLVGGHFSERRVIVEVTDELSA